ncbi:hypothetical protein [Caviibacterium pharyngocola]|uniref:DUF945 domain-containing protein n=1 Tax=Caviibacterium pharyngocola TaxID=28159 RepID=A0A2M8RT78_9PAST|nr:hypothetical protein [Caviibacterium pharyngocola]PJG82096.1 hypothetical protein CVP04_10600 [Caviibacterium pharyngocola]
MSKKTKITLTLSVIALALGVGAQFYTNYKIDQVLQNFPYHLRDQWTLNVTQTHKNFFNRELVFSVENADADKTDIINTKLTALPFAVTAESALPPDFVRELNITIDKNIINSKFSVIGDYLQSGISSQFRDLTNKSQVLEIDLNFASKTQFMEIKGNLSGFNYDANSKINGIKTNLTLVPIGNRQYDLAELELSLNNADIYLLDGENTNIQLNNVQYAVNKSVSADTYNLSAYVSGEKIALSGKNNREDKTQLDGLQITAVQNGIPNNVLFGNLFNELHKENADYTKLINLLSDLLFSNQTSEAKITLAGFTSPKNRQNFVSFKNADLTYKGNYADKQRAETNLAFGLGALEMNLPNDEKIALNGLRFEQQATDSNLTARLNWLKQALGLLKNANQPENFTANKDNKAFLDSLNEFSRTFNEKNRAKLTLKSLELPNRIDLKGIGADYSEMPSGENQYTVNFTTQIERYRNEADAIEVNDIKLDLPLIVERFDSVLPLYLCSNQLFALNCLHNLSEKTLNELIDTPLRELGLSVKQAKLSADVNSIPNTDKTPISAELNLDVPPIKNNRASQEALIEERMESILSDFTLTIPKTLLTDDKQIKAKLIDENPFWKALAHQLKQKDKLNPYFVETDDSYKLHWENTADGVLINGKPPVQIEPEEEIPEWQFNDEESDEPNQPTEPAIESAQPNETAQ